MAAQFFFFIFFLVLLHALFLFNASAITHWQDIDALKQLKNSVNPDSVTPGSCLSSWNFTADPCDSILSEKFTCGLRCDAVVFSESRVTEIALDRSGYSGSLESVSWNLPYLQKLDLSGNSFDGYVPGDSFLNLTRLRVLSLSRNSFSGWIPSSLASLSALEEVYLDGNRFEGPVPSLGGLKNLTRLELQDNSFSGEFPELGGLASLRFVDASNNAFSGEMRASLPSSLVELVARNNIIEGNIPAGIAGLSSLQVLDLSHNRLTGSVPASLFTHRSLQQVNLSHNKYGSVQEPDPNSINTSQLVAVDLTHNEIRGSLPEFLGLLPRLSSLSLEYNKLSGMIPAQYALKGSGSGSSSGRVGENPSQFERLLLGGNYLFGAIPGPFLKAEPGSVTIRLGDNCLYRCPRKFAVCQGGEQKSLSECKAFGPTTLH